ncbi:MAG: hypothetical protein ACXVCP_01970 [Bdellovibrio sp.]
MKTITLATLTVLLVQVQANAGFLCKGNRLHSSESEQYLPTTSSAECDKILINSKNGFFCIDGYLYNKSLQIIEYGEGNYDGFKNNNECLERIARSIK